MRRKTIEEIRATNRERQRRWRGKHLWLSRERVKAVRGKSRAQELVNGVQGGAGNNAIEGGLISVPLEEVELDARQLAAYRARSEKVRKELVLPPEPVFHWDPRGEPELSAEEKRLLAQIERLKKRPKGVVVEGFE